MSVQDLRRRLFFAQGVVLFWGTLRLFFFVLVGMAVASVIQICVGLILSPSIEWLRGSWILLAGAVLVLAFNVLKTLLTSCQLPSLATKLGAQPADLLLTAWELGSQNMTDEFRTRAVTQAAHAFPKRWERRFIPAPRTLGTGTLTVCLFFLIVIGIPKGNVLIFPLWPFGRSFSGILSVTPGNSVFPRGEDVAVTVRVSTEEFSPPRLEVREERSAWEERSLHYVSRGEYSLTLRSLQNPLEYRIIHHRARSARYRLVPFDPPKLLHLQAKIHPPAYSGKETEQLQDVNSLRVLSGSRVQWSFLLAPANSLVRIDPEPSSPLIKKGEEWSFAETVENKQDHRVWARLTNGSSDVLLTELTVDTDPDEPPRVIFLAPTDDLEADGKDPIPVTVEITEDVGLAQVGISFRANQGVWKRTAWKHFAPGTLHEMVENVFDLKETGNPVGKTVDFYIWARDHRSPPGEGRSETRHVDILDYQTIHDQVLGDLESFQKSLRDRVTEEREIREKVAISTPVWRGLLTDQRQVARRLLNEEDRFLKLLERMAQDPRTDRVTLMEHEGLAESLRNLNRSTMPGVDQQISAQDRARSTRALDQAVSELGRMSRLSADAIKEQQMRELMRDQSHESNRAENLVRSLGKHTGLSEEDLRQFKETVRSMKEALDRIRERVDKLRENLAEEEWKNATIEELRFDRVTDSLTRLSQALQEKNGADALAAAQNVLDQLREIEKQLYRSGPNPSSFGSQAEAALTEEQELIKALIQRQESLLDRTRDVADKKRSRFLAQQSDALRHLRRTASQWESRAGNSATPEIQLLGTIAGKIWRALDSGQGKVVLERLNEFIVKAAPLSPDGSNNNDGVPFAAEGKVILEELTVENEDNALTDSEKTHLSRWAEEQHALAESTRSLLEKLTATVRQTALVPPTIPERISEAASRMDEASLSLQSREVPMAQNQEEKALDLLRDTNEKLSNILNQIQSLSWGSGGTHSLRRRGGSVLGGNPGNVKIPRAEDFRSPVEFRQELMDSMKDAYPKEEKGPVQNYYRHWTK